jgi:hypothetical protein
VRRAETSSAHRTSQSAHSSAPGDTTRHRRSRDPHILERRPARAPGDALQPSPRPIESADSACRPGDCGAAHPRQRQSLQRQRWR